MAKDGAHRRGDAPSLLRPGPGCGVGPRILSRRAGRCSLPGRTSVADLGDTIHGLSVGVYLLAFVFAAICAGVVLLRRRRRGPGAVILVLAALSILTASQMDERTPGAEQRLWLAVNALGLVALAGFAGSDPRKQVTPE